MIKSKLDTNSTTFHANAAHMEGLVTDLHEKIAKICEGGSERARKKHLDRGKLLPRERVERLLDPGTPFLELSQLAACAAANMTDFRLAENCRSRSNGSFTALIAVIQNDLLTRVSQ